MFEQTYKVNDELAADRNQLTVARAASNQTANAGDAVAGVLRNISDLTFVVLMIVIAVAQPLWVLLLTRFVYF